MNIWAKLMAPFTSRNSNYIQYQVNMHHYKVHIVEQETDKNKLQDVKTEKIRGNQSKDLRQLTSLSELLTYLQDG